MSLESLLTSSPEIQGEDPAAENLRTIMSIVQRLARNVLKHDFQVSVDHKTAAHLMKEALVRWYGEVDTPSRFTDAIRSMWKMLVTIDANSETTGAMQLPERFQRLVNS